MKFGGIIIAGGQSKRMGYDKGLAEYKGRSLIEYAIDLLHPFCERIIVSANDPEYEKFGYEVVPDVVKNKGPAGGIYSALQVSDHEYNIVVSCDMPYLNHEAVKLITDRVNNATCYIPIHNSFIEPLFGVYNISFEMDLAEAINEGYYKLRDILKRPATIYVSFDGLVKKYPRLFDNFNYISDLNK